MKREAVSLPVLDGHLRLPRAAASAYLLVLISKDGDHRSLPPGRYACELIKEDSGQWRFSRRVYKKEKPQTPYTGVMLIELRSVSLRLR